MINLAVNKKYICKKDVFAKYEAYDTFINKARVWVQKGVCDKDNIAKNSLIAPVIHKRYKQSRKDSTKNRF